MKIKFWDRSLRQDCVAVERGERCSFTAKLSIPFGKSPTGTTCYLRLCGIHAHLLVKGITGQDLPL